MILIFGIFHPATNSCVHADKRYCTLIDMDVHTHMTIGEHASSPASSDIAAYNQASDGRPLTCKSISSFPSSLLHSFPPSLTNSLLPVFFFLTSFLIFLPSTFSPVPPSSLPPSLLPLYCTVLFFRLCYPLFDRRYLFVFSFFNHIVTQALSVFFCLFLPTPCFYLIIDTHNSHFLYPLLFSVS